jgi:hypothetical protein
MAHYHVLRGLRGLYMPDDNQTIFTTTWDAAFEVAREAARDDAEAYEYEAFDNEPAQVKRGEYAAWHTSPDHCVELCACDDSECREDEP